MALGLPIAVTIGWQLATPATRSVAIDETPAAGAGGMGAAPARHTRPAPAAAAASVPSQLPSVKPSVSPPAVRPISMPASGAPTATTAPPTETVSKDPLPPLTMPPVPTPTEPDWFPSVSPSDLITLSDSGFFEPHFGWSGH